MKPLDWSPLLVIVWEVRVVVEHAAFVELLDQRIGLGGGVLLFDVASLHSFPLTPTGLLHSARRWNSTSTLVRAWFSQRK